MSSVIVKRDTDADWRELGQSQPYWGVLSHPDFLRENITPEGIENFYLSGRQYIDLTRRYVNEFKGLVGGAR